MMYADIMLSHISQYAVRTSVIRGEDLYILTFENRHTGEIRYEFLDHSFKVDRMVLCGGNAGMSYPSEFQGNIKGVSFEFIEQEWKCTCCKPVNSYIV